MFKTLANAMKVKEIRMRLLFTFLMLLVVRFGSLLPIPGVDTSYFNTLLSGDGFDFFNAVTGGSFLTMSVFALSITPYITSSIIMQLLTIAIPKLEEMQKEGEDGRKKIAEYTRYVTVALALIESIAMAVGFGGRGLFKGYVTMSGFEMFLQGLVMVVTLTAGSAFLMWLGERITDKGVGNGISIILVISIVSRIPEDFVTLYQQFIQNKSVLRAVIAIVIIAAVIIGMVAFIVYLNAGTKNIPVQYSQKISGNTRSGGQKSV
ncbi:MAG: preprotein translocase subunit SecY, partial [Lachnospiraceae bacterium]